MDNIEEIKKLLIGDEIPEQIYNSALFNWELYTKREPLQPFLVCSYPSFEALCSKLGQKLPHVKTTSKGVPYAAFELDLKKNPKLK